ELNAVRWNDWKVNFAVQTGNIATGVRSVPGWPSIVHLRADPYERAVLDSEMYLRWYADQMWLFVPVQQKIKEFLVTIPPFPFQEGSSLNAAGINYQTLKAASAMKRLQEIENLYSPRNGPPGREPYPLSADSSVGAVPRGRRAHPGAGLAITP